MKNDDSRHSVFLSYTLKHQPQLYGYIFAMVPNLSVVDDLVQETILVMWEKFESFEPGTSFFAWAKKIAYYKVINYLDRAHHSDVYFNKEILENIEKNSIVFENTDTRIEALEECMAKLKDKDKELLKLKYVEGLSIKEVAIKVSRPIQGMYKVMARIHNTLENCVRANLAAELTNYND